MLTTTRIWQDDHILLIVHYEPRTKSKSKDIIEDSSYTQHLGVLRGKPFSEVNIIKRFHRQLVEL